MSETKFSQKNENFVNASQFAKMIGCSFDAVKKMFGTKLTEGISYLKEAQEIVIDVECAKKELQANVNPSTCKNPKLLEWLELDKMQQVNLSSQEDEQIDSLNDRQVREEMNKSLLRLSIMQEKILDQKYIERIPAERAMEGIGIEIRNAFSQLSSKVTPQMLASKTPRDAENVLHAHIEELLTMVSNITTQGLIDAT